MAGFSLQNHPERENGVRFFLEGEFADHYGNLERAGNLMKRNGCGREEGVYLLGSMIDQPLNIGAIKKTRDDGEASLFS